MNNLASDKSHIPCQTWVNPDGWSTTSSQGFLINTDTNSQHLSMSSSDQRPLYNHLQESNRNSMSNLNTIPSRNNSHNTAIFKTPHMDSVLSSSSVFHNSAIHSAPHLMSFAQQVSHNSSMLVAPNQGNTISQPCLPQTNQEPQAFRSQHLPPLSASNPYKSFQTQLLSQSLPSGIQDQSFNLSSCGSNVNMSQATFGGHIGESKGVDGSANGYDSSTSQEQTQWMSSSHPNRASVNSVSHRTSHVSQQQEEHISSLTDSEKRRSILNQRAELLKQLKNIDVLLESLPPDDCNDGQLSHEAVQSQLSTDCSSSLSCNKQSNMSDDLEEPMSPADSVETQKSCNGSENDFDLDYIPQSEGNVSDSDQSENTADSEDCHSNPSSPTDDTQQEKSASPQKKTQKTNQNKLSESVVVPTSNRKERRLYDKRNFCLFCSKPVLKLSRHLTRFHSDKAEVAVAFQHPAHSKERKRIWEKLMKEGNFAHNKDVLKTGEGQLVVQTRPKNPAKAADYVPCIYCLGLFRKKLLWRHVKNCLEKPKEEETPQWRKKRVISHGVLLTKNCGDLSEGFRNLLGEMINDDVTETILEDPIILQFGEQIFSANGVKKEEYIRQALRHTARLVLEAQKSTPMQSLEDFFGPSNFQHVVSALKVLAGYDPKKKTFTTPSLALKLGYHLQKICGIVQQNAVKSGDDKLAESCENFLALYQKKWNKLISSRALKNIKEMKRQNEKDVPLAEDVKLLHSHMENIHQLAEKKLKENICVENYAALAKIILARTIIFNRRKPKEVATIPITAFMARKKSDVLDDLDVSVSNLERTLCGFFSRVDIKGNCGRMLPVLLKPSFESAMELLMNVRKECGVLSDNPFVFAQPASLYSINGSKYMRQLMKECGAKNPDALTFVKLRKHFPTMLQLMHLNEDETRQIFGSNDQIQVLLQSDNGLCDDSLLERGDSHYKTKPKWDDSEVQAVERHLMDFIKEQRLPQKDDCVRCLEAETRALRNRSWKGVKDYVRNRITTLQRQSGSSKDSQKTSKKPRQEEPQQRSVRPQPLTRKEAANERHNESSGSNVEPSNPNPPQTHRVTTSNKRAAPKLDKGREKGSRHKAKPKWSESEVDAVEKHLMRFIKEHKVPQKEDCVQCLEAELHALRHRSWKGVKDYVRNRITTLQRQSSSSKSSQKTRNRSRREEPQSSFVRPQPSKRQEAATDGHNMVSALNFEPTSLNQQDEDGVTSYNKTATSVSDKSRKDLQHKAKHKWDEAEVRAVERHLMQFIKKQKLPKKDDCVFCLESEPRALKNRSWKSIKDYVRNRITSLQRQNGNP